MAFQPTPADISVAITTPMASSSAEPRLLTERRITPTWSVSQLKGKLETMTGVPPGSQRLLLKSPGRPDQWVEGDDSIIGDWGLMKGCEIEVGLVLLFISISGILGFPSLWDYSYWLKIGFDCHPLNESMSCFFKTLVSFCSTRRHISTRIAGSYHEPILMSQPRSTTLGLNQPGQISPTYHPSRNTSFLHPPTNHSRTPS